MKNSVWSNGVTLPSFKELHGDTKTDVLIVGGGICGILCAYFLKKAGVNCILVEAQRIAQATTANTTAKITLLHGLIYNELTHKKGKESAQKYLKANQLALNKYAEIAKDLDCDFERLPAYTYSKNDAQKIENEVVALKNLGVQAEFKKHTELPFDVEGAVCIKNQAQFNPLKFINGILDDLTIFENTMVKEITPQYAVCDNGKIFAEKIIIATHFPFINTHGSYFLKLYQHRSYVLALENAQSLNGMYVDEAQDGLSLRSYDNLLLLGGCGQRTGKKCGNWDLLNNIKDQYYPKSKVAFSWATQDCMSLDKIPYIGQYSKQTPNLLVATGFNKWGMTSAMVSAIILCDLVQNIQSDYADIFSPSRNIFTKQLFVNGFETISNFVYPTAKRCSHMGCALKWNKAEHTWDCPCHGSRFDKNGKLINNPSKKDANI